jgi:2-keto-4-pentenoate hydratase
MNNHQKSDFDPSVLARALHEVRQSAATQPTASFTEPPTIDAAMSAQKHLSELEQTATSAWKVAVTPEGTPVVARLHPYVERPEDAKWTFVPGMKFEVEIAVRLARDLPPREDLYSRPEIIDSISEAYLGAELIGSAIAEGGKVSFPLYLADRIGNRGYFLGPELPKSFLNSIGDMSLEVAIDDTVLYAGLPRHPAGDVVEWLLYYANEKNRSKASLVSGSIVTTGALCGALPLSGGGTVEATLGHYKISMPVN